MNILKNLDAKIITSVGGIVIAVFLSYILYKVLTNDLSHLNASIQEQAQVNRETNAVLKDLSANLQGQTEILRILERRLR